MNGWHQQLANKTAVAGVILLNAYLARRDTEWRMEPEVQSSLQAVFSDVLLGGFWFVIVFGGAFMRRVGLALPRTETLMEPLPTPSAPIPALSMQAQPQAAKTPGTQPAPTTQPPPPPGEKK